MKSSKMVQLVLENWKSQQEKMQVPQEQINREIARLDILPPRSFSEWVLQNMQENLAPAIAR